MEKTSATHTGRMYYDVVVIGGGHAGVEAAWAAAQKKCSVLCVTGNLDLIGQMPCNPSIGGVAKGHLVREIDMLGGVMGHAIDATGIHFKMLNRTKGYAVWGNRAQADKQLYRRYVRGVLENHERIHLMQSFVTALEKNSDRTFAVTVLDGFCISCRCVVCAMGTFCNGEIYIGLDHYSAGRSGEMPSRGLSECLQHMGIQAGRLKTGTSPRIHARGIDYAQLEAQKGDEPPQPFSYRSPRPPENKACCWITRTTRHTHDIIRHNLDRSPLYTGIIQSAGPRYCPSIEDKVMRFGDRNGHTLFLEPEGIETHEYYINGLSSSLPFDVQKRMLTTIPGLAHADIIRPGYGIEYDFFYPEQLTHALESQVVEGLFCAGQINGTSGYEEAAAQGIVAGINAAEKVRGGEPLHIGRDQAYIGVLIDDIVTKGVREPYRMFTSRAEYRLCMRQDNVDERVLELARARGMIDECLYAQRCAVIRKKQDHIAALRSLRVQPDTWNACHASTHHIQETTRAYALLKRPGITLQDIQDATGYAIACDEMRRRVHADIVYEGFVKKQQKEIERRKAYEAMIIPDSVRFEDIGNLRSEARGKCARVRPETIGQACRIPGITPADITVLIEYVIAHRREGVSTDNAQ